jgi:hypothetical protein
LLVAGHLFHCAKGHNTRAPLFRRGSALLVSWETPDVGFGSKADIRVALIYVRSTPKADNVLIRIKQAVIARDAWRQTSNECAQPSFHHPRYAIRPRV